MKRNFTLLTPIVLASIPFVTYAEEAKLQLAQVVQATLDYSPIIRNSSLSVDIARGTARIQSGAFNVNANASVNYNDSYDPFRADTDQQAFSAGLSKRFRSGVGTNLTYDLNRTDETNPFPQFGTMSSSRVSFIIEVPLLKGGWEVSAAADEKAAKLEQQAAEADFRQLITATILSAVQAHWNYTAAYRIEEYRRQSQKRVEDWMKGDQRLSGFLSGFLEEKKANVVTAVQQLEQTRLELARAIGIPTDKANTIANPDTTAFPTEWEDVLKRFDYEKIKKQWLDLAVANRNDIKAARLRLEASETTLAKAKQDLYPELTVRGGVGYNGSSFDNGFNNFVSATHRNVRGVDHNASLTFSYPLGNDAAEGFHDIAQAQKGSSTVTLNETTRGIKLSVEQDVAAVHGRLQNLIQNRRTMESYISSIQDLVETSDLLVAENVTNLIVLQDKLDSAAVAYISVFAELANAIAQARFQTGVLINNDDSIDIEKIAELPSI